MVLDPPENPLECSCSRLSQAFPSIEVLRKCMLQHSTPFRRSTSGICIWFTFMTVMRLINDHAGWLTRTDVCPGGLASVRCLRVTSALHWRLSKKSCSPNFQGALGIEWQDGQANMAVSIIEQVANSPQFRPHRYCKGLDFLNCCAKSCHVTRRVIWRPGD
jgi:hypothetical protein